MHIGGVSIPYIGDNISFSITLIQRRPPPSNGGWQPYSNNSGTLLGTSGDVETASSTKDRTLWLWTKHAKTFDCSMQMAWHTYHQVQLLKKSQPFLQS